MAPQTPASPKGTRPTRWILGGLGLVAAIGLVVLLLRPRPVEVDVAPVRRGLLTVYVEEDGLARVKDRYVVSTPVTGTLARLERHAGDIVATGDVLARVLPLSPALLDARSRAQAQAQVAAAAAGEAQARATVERARMGAEQAKRERERREKLAAAGATAAIDLDLAQFEERGRAQDLRSATFGAEVAAYQLRQAQAVLGRVGAAPGDELEITAPVAGGILRVLHESAGAVTAGTPLLELGDPAALEIVVDLLTQDAARVRPGARTMLAGWGGEDLTGRVRLVEPSAFTRLSALGVQEQRVNCIVDLDGPADTRAGLGDGWRVETRILVAEATDVVMVPESAVFREGEGHAVYRVVDGKATYTTVVLGLENGVDAEVQSGLGTDDEVVVFPGDRVADGVALTVR